MGSLTRKAAIVGTGLSDCGVVSDKTSIGLAVQATKRALDDAGLVKEDIDALFNTGLPGATMQLGEYLQIEPSISDSTSVGGASFEFHLQHATAAIAAGLCHTALICFGGTAGSDRKRAGLRREARGGLRAPTTQFEASFGQWTTASYALAAQRHMHQYGTTNEQLAEIAVATRKWAAMNPTATMRNPITIEDVINSPIISSPLHLLDCCLITDAGGAIIVTSPERAKDLKKPPVWVLGCGESHSHTAISGMPDLTILSAKKSGEAAFKMAGLTPKDIDVAELYDSFTITVLLELEDLGFCQKGEGGSFVEGQRTAPGGKFPMNTNGGGLSWNHAGTYGIFLLIEATRQLRGECGERQVPKAQIALCNGVGGTLSSCGTIILGRD